MNVTTRIVKTNRWMFINLPSHPQKELKSNKLNRFLCENKSLLKVMARAFRNLEPVGSRGEITTSASAHNDLIVSSLLWNNLN